MTEGEVLTPEATPEPTETIEMVVEEPRLFLATPFEEYTVTEGLLLTLVLLVVVSFLVKTVKEGFYWLF